MEVIRKIVFSYARVMVIGVGSDLKLASYLFPDIAMSSSRSSYGQK